MNNWKVIREIYNDGKSEIMSFDVNADRFDVIDYGRATFYSNENIVAVVNNFSVIYKIPENIVEYSKDQTQVEEV